MKLKKLLFSGIAALFFGTASFAQNLNTVFDAQLTYPGQTCANISGYVDSLGNEYALVGAAQGMSIVNVNIPSAPVQVLQVPGINNLWREIKVRGKYAYVTTEGGGGLQIINLSSLPNTLGVVAHNWTGTGAGSGLTNIHALHIDNNFIYLYGSNLFGGGAYVADLTDPWNPVYVGNYQNLSSGTSAYVHDGYVRNDTLYGGHIYDGFYDIVDFTNKAAPVELASQFTPGMFTHNTWLSKDSKTLFTTDEQPNTYLTSYDVSNVASINELDRIQTDPGSNSYVHNVHIINKGGNDYAVTSWYSEGFTITDVGRPQNMIEVGKYDTFTSLCAGEVGAWGVYPYLPSGNIVVSNINEGLFVITPTYVRACYLEGNITDVGTGLPINGVKVEILTTSGKDVSNIAGDYKTGIPSPGGTYSIKFSKPGYLSTTVSGISLSAGVVTPLNATLAVATSFVVNGQVKDAGTSAPIVGAKVRISNGNFTFNATTNATGNYSFPAVFPDSYDVIVSMWGYETSCLTNQTINSGTGPLTTSLTKGYYDDFSLDLGWTVATTATTGAWERGVPLGTANNCVPANPGYDDTTDCSNMAYVTGNTGITASDQDVDNGNTRLMSPSFSLTSYLDPYVDYSRWFYNAGGAGSPNDSISIYINNGTTTVLLDFAVASSPGSSTWVHKSFQVSAFITPSATMSLMVRTADNAPGHIVEAGFDKFVVSEGPTGISEHNNQISSAVNVYPNPFTNETNISYRLTNKIVAGASIVMFDVTGRIISTTPISQSEGVVAISPSVNSGIYYVRIINGNEITEPVKVMKLK
jgi:choice-of-anchor B domain-containing protein